VKTNESNSKSKSKLEGEEEEERMKPVTGFSASSNKFVRIEEHDLVFIGFVYEDAVYC